MDLDTKGIIAKVNREDLWRMIGGVNASLDAFKSDDSAWDAVISGPGGRCGVEAETRPTDLQALERRIALKQRDGDVDCVILLLLASAHNRALVRAHEEALAARFPAMGGEILERLARGKLPLASGIVLL